MGTVLMADSAQPWLIPPSIRYAAAYPVGRFTWTDDQVDRFQGHIMCAEDPAIPAKTVAAVARELGIEDRSYGPADAPAFHAARLAVGHSFAQFYVNRSNIGAVAAELDAAGVDRSTVRWRVATLDGTRTVAVPWGLLWAVQFTDHSGAYDLSVVYGPFDFTVG